MNSGGKEFIDADDWKIYQCPDATNKSTFASKSGHEVVAETKFTLSNPWTQTKSPQYKAGFLAEDASKILREMETNRFTGTLNFDEFKSEKSRHWPELRFASLRFDDSGLSDCWAIDGGSSKWASGLQERYQYGLNGLEQLRLNAKCADEGLSVDWL